MSTLRVDNIKSRTGSVVTVPETNTLAVTGIVSVTGGVTNSGNFETSGNANVSGVSTFTGAVTYGGNATVAGNMIINGSLTNNGTFSYNNLNVTNDAQVGGALTVTGDLTVNGTTTTIDSVNLVVEDKNIGIGAATAPSNTTANGGGLTLFGGSDGDKAITWNNSSPDYWEFTGGLLKTPGLDLSNILKEGVNITAGKLSSNLNINIENGMVHLFTTAETTTSTPNIRYNATTSLDSVMSIGEAITVCIITTANASAYCTQLTIDGNNVTENWIGGAAPGDGGSSGVDIHTFNIIKTGGATFTVIANQSKTS